MIFVLTVALSVGTIYASDVNVTDSYAAESVDNATIAASDDASEIQATESVVDNDSSNDVLKSEDSSTLSTNIEDNNSLTSDNDGSAVLTTDNDDINVLTSDNKNNVLSSSVSLSKTVTAKDVIKYYKGSTKYTATFLYKNGTALANTNVKIKLNNVVYTKQTDSNGVVSLNINLKPGTYKIVATNPKTGYSLTNNVKILSTIVSSDISKVYADSKKFTATFLKSNGKALANTKVKFKIKGKTYQVKTNSKGEASLSLVSIPKGTYKIISYNIDGLTKTNKVKVVASSKTSLRSYDYIFLTSDENKKVKVKLLDEFGFGVSKKFIIFKINGKRLVGKTSSYGNVRFKLSGLEAGVYKTIIKFPKSGNYKRSVVQHRITIIPTKNPTLTVKSTTKFGYGAKTPFKVALTSGNVPIANKEIKLTVDGHSYTKTTNGKGIVSLPINLKIGTYTISYSSDADSKVNAKSGSTSISVVKRGASTISWKSPTTFYQGIKSCKLLLLDSKKKAISGATVKLTVKSKTYTGKTNSKGYVTINVNFAPGTYKVSYKFNGNNLKLPSSGLKKLTVKKVPKLSIKYVIAGAKTIKSYYAKHGKLPSSVTAGGIKFTMPEFLYIMGGSISGLGSSKNGNAAILYGVKAPKSPTGDKIYSVELYKKDYITVAKNIVNYINHHKQAPRYASSAVGKIIYSELIDGFSRILAFYGNNDKLMPNYCVITYNPGGSPGSQGGTGLNEKNTIANLKIYLKATANCQVGNSKLKSKVNSLISGLSSNEAKAKAIYNYVRDSISYSFYYDTNHGALGTYNYGSGNCVDQAHLLVAMYRTAGLPARYVHGTCTFSSGSTYGHVWAQVLVDGYWNVVDPTSSRNSYGNVVNWNTNSFSFQGTYSELPF